MFGRKVGSFIGKAAPIIRTVGNGMSYFPGKVGEIDKTISHYSEMLHSFTGLILDSQVKNKIIQYR
jgi:hypothetical protein